MQQAFMDLGGLAHTSGEIAKATGLDDSVVHRILQSGVYQGTFIRVKRGVYQLGTGAAKLGIHALAHDELVGDRARAVLQELRLVSDGGLALLYALAPFGGAQRQCIEMAVGDSDLVEVGMTPREILTVGRSLRTGASGRVILAYLPDAIQQRVLAEPVVQEAGPGVITDNDVLLSSLDDIRDQGHAVGRQECMRGWNSCAAPVMWNDSIMGAVLLLRPAHLMPEVPPKLIEATKHAAAQLSRTGGSWPASGQRA
ncbi:IclR family transcriptional regulator C-terminal domain-containing protein [Streptomyces sp. NPDC048636]|uniref:IclR family transcriptional regulator n=1 Tax=Streptomyces sp. NPDC048636 TaxID=3155762 RepID=UPI003412C637